MATPTAAPAPPPAPSPYRLREQKQHLVKEYGKTRGRSGGRHARSSAEMVALDHHRQRRHEWVCHLADSVAVKRKRMRTKQLKHKQQRKTEDSRAYKDVHDIGQRNKVVVVEKVIYTKTRRKVVTESQGNPTRHLVTKGELL